MGRILKKCHSTIQGGNSNLPLDLPINIQTNTHKTKTKKIKMVYTQIQIVNNVETFNLKSSTDDASLINYYQEGDYSIPQLFS